MKNQTALITGASSGIGYEMAKEIARHNYDVILVARREDKLRELEKQLEKHVAVTVIVLDLAREGAAQTLFDSLQGRPIDLLINNAGFADYALFAESSLSKISAMMQVNMIALTQITHLFLPPMIARGQGRILQVASIAGFFPGPQMSIYYATKAYVLSFSEALANEVKGTRVSVTCLCPGATTSEFQARAHMKESKLTNATYMSSKTVARRGIAAALRSDGICIPGLFNRFLVQVPRFVPRGAMTNFMRHIQDRIPTRSVK
jgi:short-subunit dehydrogenase